MEDKKHDEVMTKVTKIFAEEGLRIGEAISIWYSLGMFLFQHVDKNRTTKQKIYDAMNEYLETVQKEEITKDEEKKKEK